MLDENDRSSRAYNMLDILLVTFEGVLGAFLPLKPQKQEEKTDMLVLRPGIVEAMTSLLKSFKVVIVTRDRSTIHHNVIMKALDKSKVPYDAFYRTNGLSNDDFFTYECI